MECGDFAQVRYNNFHVDNMKQLYRDLHIDSITAFLKQIHLFFKQNLIAIFKIVYCFTFVSDHNTECTFI